MLVLGSDADAGVFHLDAEPFTAIRPHAKRDTPSFWRELDRVGEVVVEHLLEPHRIEVHSAERIVEVEPAPNVRAQVTVELGIRARKPSDLPPHALSAGLEDLVNRAIGGQAA